VNVERLRDRILATDAPGWVILIRLTVGAVFLSEGIQKLLYPAELAAAPLITIMLVAIATTKVPILLASGFWKMAHEARTNYSMLLGSLFLLIVGGGPWSIDASVRKPVGRESQR
jgi:putative oxidoreductase